MPPCVLDAAGFCKRHMDFHVGALLEISQLDSPEAEEYRVLWDEQFAGVVPLTRKQLPPPPALPPPKQYDFRSYGVRCQHRGPDLRDSDGRALTRDCGLG